MRNTPWARPALGTGLLLLIPLAMTFIDRGKPAGDGWHWDPFDFLIMGALLFGAGTAYELVSRKQNARPQRIVTALAILGVVLLIWTELAVGAVSQLFAYLFA